jgi:glycerol-3-phosphate cytidylyltransferase-like family protein
MFLRRITDLKWCKRFISDDDRTFKLVTELLNVRRIDYVVHGDDPCIVDGKDVYETAQKLGKCIIARKRNLTRDAIRLSQ